MGRKDIIMASAEELRRLDIVKRALDGMISQKDSADVVGLSYRQMKRLVARVRVEGEAGIVHRLRGEPGNRGIDEEIKDKVLELYHKKYWDFGPTFAAEKLQELDSITVSHETLRLWLVGEGRQEWQRKARPHRQWRQRKDYFGQMVQVDGSHHDWLEGRGPWLVLMGYVDDATGNTFGRFYDYEGTMPAMDSLMRYIEKYGIPQSIYLDKHTTYKSPRKEQTIEEILKNQRPMTQFGRAAKELGIIVIYANSAPAKGRVERGFGTHQDRLVKEMRLAGIKTGDEANEFLEWYLPKHNRKFSITPAKKVNLHRKSPGKKELNKILCTRVERSLRNDAVIEYNNKFYQIKDIPRRRIKKVMVETRLDGSMHVRNNGSYFNYKEIAPELIRRAGTEKKVRNRARKVYIPPKDHPWRQYDKLVYKEMRNWDKVGIL